MPWLDGVSVPERFGALLGVPTVAVHDGRAAALAEARLGAGRGSDDVFVLALGTGVAGAHVVRGTVRTGAHDGAGEAGHVSLDPAGPPCGCGQRGCLEAYVGAPHLAALWQQATGDPHATAADLLHAATTGDRRAVEIVDAAGTALARSILGIVAVVDPGRVVVGGGLAVPPSPLLPIAAEKARRWATFHRVPPVVPASLGPWAGAWGAALSAAG
jgi:glucokinase